MSSPDPVAAPLPAEAAAPPGPIAARAPILSVPHLVKHFTGRSGRTRFDIHAVCDVSFDLAEGETLGLVGESGCGKSTTGRAILQLHRATAGEVMFKGVELTKLGDALRDVLDPRQLHVIRESGDPSLRSG